MSIKLPNRPVPSRIPTSLLVAAWAVAVVLAASCLVWALLSPAGDSNQTAYSATPTRAAQSAATKPAATTVPAQPAATKAPAPTSPSVKATQAPSNPAPPTTAPKPTALPVQETFGYGIQVNGFDDPDGSIAMTKQLGMTWIKQQVVWGSLEHEKGNMDWSGLDRVVRKANKADLKIMLSIVTSPTWSHPAIGPGGDDKEGIKAPPDDLNAYANFVAQVVQREKDLGYPVHAVEVWNEQNLSREWRTSPQKIDAAKYMQMLTATYKKVKAIDPNIIVISGAPSPTGVDNGIDATDDLNYLKQMVSYGLLNSADCIGIHHNGYNLPPDVPYQDTPKNPKAATATNYPAPFDPAKLHHSWSFYTTLQESARIVKPKPLCITEFGWASSVGISTPVRSGFEFAGDNTLQEQADYIIKAYQLMKQWGFVKIAFLWNLNFFNVTDDRSTTDNAIYSVLTPGGMPRPAFEALGKMPK